MNVTIIPARGGSKGIPRKNLLPLCGKPLIAWTIEAALRSRHAGRVVVSTDDEEIAAVARRFGSDVIRRPDHISGDRASSESALLHALETLEDREAFQPELLVFLQCTSPLTLPEDIDGAVEELRRQEADSALSVSRFHHFLWTNGSDGATGVNHDKTVRKPRQQQEPQYLETGAVYVMDAAGFRRAGHRFFGKVAMHVTPAQRCHEIDEPADVPAAEQKLRALLRDRRAEALPETVGALVMDFDGVFTDNRVYVGQDGSETVACSRGDGMGLERLRQANLPMLVLSKEANPVVAARCRKLRLECIQEQQCKLPVMLEWLRGRGVEPAHAVYVGNDINDLECMQAVGCPVAVADAHPQALRSARIVLEAPGGAGALRELSDMIERRLGGGQNA